MSHRPWLHLCTSNYALLILAAISGNIFSTMIFSISFYMLWLVCWFPLCFSHSIKKVLSSPRRWYSWLKIELGSPLPSRRIGRAYLTKKRMFGKIFKRDWCQTSFSSAYFSLISSPTSPVVFVTMWFFMYCKTFFLYKGILPVSIACRNKSRFDHVNSSWHMHLVVRGNTCMTKCKVI